MNKLTYIIFGLAGLAMASCSNDEVKNITASDGNLTFTVKLPETLSSRAYGNGYASTQLQVIVYDTSGGSPMKVTDAKADFGESLETNVGLNLVTGKTYDIVFFASNPNAIAINPKNEEAQNVYNISDEDGSLSVNYSKMTSDGNSSDYYDCFYNVINTKTTPSGSTVILTRPVGQVNWGTNDLKEPSVIKYFGENGADIEWNLTATGFFDTLDLLSGDASQSNPNLTVTLSNFDNSALSSNNVTTVPGYTNIAVQYFLAPSATSASYNLALDINNSKDVNAEDIVNEIKVVNVPVQANYQTNIYGSLLTDNTNYNVIKKPADWGGSYDPSLLLALERGGTFTLEDDFVLNEKVTITKDLTINLNGHTITGPGTGTSADDGMFTVDGATLNIKGDGTLETSGSYASILVWAMNNATVNIYGGTFKANAGGEIVYIGGDAPGSTTGATVNIYGGTFIPTRESNGKYSLLNIYDPARDNSHMNVMGGIFYNWNPADNTAEGANTNFVVSGYQSVNSTIGSENAYVVVPDGTTLVSSFEEAVQASQNGENVYLTGNVSGEATTGGYGNNLGGLVVKGNTVNGNGYTFDVTNESGRTNDYIIYTSGGVIENITLTCSDKSGFKGILGEGFSYDLTLNNVNVNPDANVAYAINFSVGNGKTINATDCTFCGWSSWGTGFQQLNFNNCYWGIGTYYSGSNALFNGLVKPYATTVFENCDFNEMIYMDLSELAADATITFKNCTVNGVVLTQANHTIMKGYTLGGLEDWENYDNVANRIFFN